MPGQPNRDPRTVFITGCSTGIGHCVAHGLIKRGFTVIASARKPADVARLREQEQWRFSGFNDMTVDAVMEKTGLARERAEMAKQRDYTEPLQWQDEEDQLQQFRVKLAEHGLTAVRGGRFISISGKVDKGQALEWLRDAKPPFFLYVHYVDPHELLDVTLWKDSDDDMVPDELVGTAKLQGFDLVIARTGYTGEDIGYELFVHPDEAVDFWETLLATGEPIDPARSYVVAGWASVNEDTEGPQIWDVVEAHIKATGTVALEPNNSVEVIL